MDRGLDGGVDSVRCDQCGDVIGVYEPLVLRDGDAVRETSRAAEPDLPATAGERYHRECFASLKHRAE